MRTTKKIVSLSLMTLALAACGGGDPGDKLTRDPAVTASRAVFDPSLGASGLPFPIDLLFSGTSDGTINIPGKPNSLSTSALFAALATADGGADEAALITAATSTPAAAFLADPQSALNTMDGFSTTAPMVVRFSAAVDDPADPDDIKDNVRIFRLTTADPGANGTLALDTSAGAGDGELIWGVDFVAGVSGGTSLLIQPLKPLAPGKTHIVVIETGLKTTGGSPIGADDTYSLLNGAFQLEGAIGLVAGASDFILDDVNPCDLTGPAGVAACTNVNTESYAAVVAAVPPAAAGAQAVVDALQGLETAGQISTVIQLEQLRRIASKHLDVTGVDATAVALSYSITTENVGGAMAQAKGQVDGAGTVPDITVLNPVAGWAGNSSLRVYSPGADGDVTTPDDALAHIYVGTLDNTLQFVDATDPNNSVWESSNASWIGGVVPACAALPAHALGGTKNLVGCNQYTPAVKGSPLSIPVLISVPRQESLGGGGGGLPDCSGGSLPVVIYQHGITTNRGTLLAIADSLAAQCIVGVAIDMPKHGIAPNDATFSGLFQLQAALSGSTEGERLVKVSSPMTQCQAGQGVAVGGASSDFYCPSGDNFINLTNLANARDSLRQAVVDLHSVYRALAEGSGLTGSTGSDGTIGTTIDPANIHFAGVSLGSIVGTPFVAQQAGNLQSAVFNVGGGGIAKILDGSPAFEPSITDGLYTAAGLSKPSGDYEGFLIIAQTMVDSMDPINFATATAATGTPILAQEVIGDPSDSVTCLLSEEGCPDQVVPNNVFGASFGPAWGLVAQTGQTSYMANQNFITTPVALAGTDPLTQGTGFIAIGGAVSAGLLPVANALALGPLGGDTVVGAPLTFKGMNLPFVTSCGADGSNGVVRFTSGDHGSMLSPAADPLVTAVMQKQLATFIAQGGAVIADDTLAALGNASAGVVFEPAVASPGSTVAACAP